MRKALLALTPLLLAGCVDQSASYMINQNNEHAITVRAEQEYFWSDDVTLRLIVSNLPDCQRQYPLATLPIPESEVELYASGENVFTLERRIVLENFFEGCPGAEQLQNILDANAQAANTGPSPALAFLDGYSAETF